MDNASVNDKCLEEFADLLEAKGIDFDYRDRRINCLPHVMHISTTHILDKFFPRHHRAGARVEADAGPNVDEDDQDDFEPDPPSIGNRKQTYEEAVARNPVAILRGFIREIRSSGQRRTAFHDHIKRGLDGGWFREVGPEGGVITEVKARELLRDVPTRWDSTFLMLERARMLRPVCELSDTLSYSYKLTI